MIALGVCSGTCTSHGHCHCFALLGTMWALCNLRSGNILAGQSVHDGR
jgi:hypothetical protein